MGTMFKSAMILVVFLGPTLAGCSQGPSAESSSVEGAKPHAAEAVPSPAGSAIPTSATRSASDSPIASAAPVQDVYELSASSLGVVKFDHKLHQEMSAKKCETCHHASKPEKPAKADQQSCHDCHTKPPQAGMKTGRQAAFHNPTAQSGTCIDCHKAQNAEAKKAPVKCAECHKKASA